MPQQLEGAIDPDTQRLDKWLWYTRLVKSRTLAAGLVVGGKARVNRTRVDKASTAVRIGDTVTVVVHQRVCVLKVLALGVRRGPPTEARALYEDLSVPAIGVTASAPGPAGAGRPSKRERREISALKRGLDHD